MSDYTITFASNTTATDTSIIFPTALTLPMSYDYVWASEEAREAFLKDDADTLSEILGIDHTPGPTLWSKAVKEDKPNVIKWLWHNTPDENRPSAVQEVMLCKKWDLFRVIAPEEFDEMVLETACLLLGKSEFAPMEILIEKWNSFERESAQFKLLRAVARCPGLEGFNLVKNLLTEESLHTALPRAVANGNERLVKHLVEDLKIPVTDKVTRSCPLISNLGVVSLMKVLLDHGACPKTIMSRFETLNHPDWEVLTMLLDYGAQVASPDLFYRIIRKGDLELLGRVLADTTPKCVNAFVVAEGLPEVAQTLIDAGYTPTLQDLYDASAHSNTETMHVYLKSGLSLADLQWSSLREPHRKLVQEYLPTLWDHLEEP